MATAAEACSALFLKTHLEMLILGPDMTVPAVPDAKSQFVLI
jgi:hypothetical protein